MAPRDFTGMEFLPVPPPAAGELATLAPGFFWARMPLPFRLDHVNVWLLEEEGGFASIDAGLQSNKMREIWDAILSGPLGGRPLTRLIATHGHTDHVGFAGHLVERFDMPFVSTISEWLWARLRHAEAHLPVRPQTLDYMRRHGADEAAIAPLGAMRESFSRTLGPMPQAFQRLRDHDVLSIGGTDWRVIVGEGHSDEHAAFYSAERNMLIAGDQVLSHISPVIGVFPGEPEGDPLADYLRSLDRFADLPEDVLVLPSHGLPFRGLHARIGWLRRHHAERVDAFAALASRPITTFEAASAHFARAMAEGQTMLCMAETLAHLHRLVGEGRLTRAAGADGVLRFSAAGAA